MIYRVCFISCIVVSLYAISTLNFIQSQKTNDKYDAFLDIASTILQETFADKRANGHSDNGNKIGINEIAGIAQAIGSLMKVDGSKSTGGLDTAQILTGISQLINVNGGNVADGANFDATKIKNLINMFTPSSNDDNKRQKRHPDDSVMDNEIDSGDDSIINIASAFMNNMNNENSNEGLTKLLPMAIQVLSSFGGGGGQKDHLWNFQSLLNQANDLLNQFVNPELINTLWQNSGIKNLFNVSK